MLFIDIIDKKVNLNCIESIQIIQSNEQWFKVKLKHEYKAYESTTYSHKVEKEARRLHKQTYGVFVVIQGHTEKEIARPLTEGDYWNLYNVNPPPFLNKNHQLQAFVGTKAECEQYVQELEDKIASRYWLSHLIAGSMGALLVFLLGKI